MSRGKRFLIIAAAVLVVVGAAVFFGALRSMNFESSKLSTQKYTTNRYEFIDDFERISINVITADVSFVPLNEEKCIIECFEEEKLTHSVKIQDGALTVNTVDDRRWFDYIGISFQTPKITVYLPKDEYTSLDVRVKTGDIEIPEGYSFETVSISGSTSKITCRASVSESVEIGTTTGRIIFGSSNTERIKLSSTSGSLQLSNIDCGSLNIKNSTGKIDLENVDCGSLDIKNTTGKVSLENVKAKDSICVETTTGDVIFTRCDGANIMAKTSTGDVKGTLLSDKIFVTSTSTGEVRVPYSAGGGRCEITTSTGDITIEIK